MSACLRPPSDGPVPSRPRTESSLRESNPPHRGCNPVPLPLGQGRTAGRRGVDPRAPRFGARAARRSTAFIAGQPPAESHITRYRRAQLTHNRAQSCARSERVQSAKPPIPGAVRPNKKGRNPLGFRPFEEPWRVAGLLGAGIPPRIEVRDTTGATKRSAELAVLGITRRGQWPGGG